MKTHTYECVSVCVMDTILLAQLRTVIWIAIGGSLSLRNVETIIKIISVAIKPQVAYQDIFLSTYEMIYRMEYRPIFFIFIKENLFFTISIENYW